jgi:hypothetical protein
VDIIEDNGNDQEDIQDLIERLMTAEKKQQGYGQSSQILQKLKAVQQKSSSSDNENHDTSKM